MGNLRAWRNNDARVELAIVLFLEDADSVALSKGTLRKEDAATYDTPSYVQWAEYLMDRAVRWMQPDPKVAHVELLLVDSDSLAGNDSASMATYVGDNADWRSIDEFYLQRQWRALPWLCVLPERGVRLRTRCNSEVGAPYSLLQYIASTRWTQSLARAFNSSKTRSASHCATLTARLLKNANPHDFKTLPHGQDLPATFSPSLLFNHVAGCMREISKASHMFEPPPSTSTQTGLDSDKFERMSDAELIAAGEAVCKEALAARVQYALETIASTDDPHAPNAVDAQRRLANMAIRATHKNRRATKVDADRSPALELT